MRYSNDRVAQRRLEALLALAQANLDESRFDGNVTILSQHKPACGYPNV